MAQDTTMIAPPSPRACIAPLLPALGPATVSATPPQAILPLLSPILRQRVQLLSSSDATADPWIRLLCRDPANVARLAEEPLLPADLVIGAFVYNVATGALTPLD